MIAPELLIECEQVEKEKQSASRLKKLINSRLLEKVVRNPSMILAAKEVCGTPQIRISPAPDSIAPALT